MRKKLLLIFYGSRLTDWLIALMLCWGTAYLFYEDLMAMALFTLGAIVVVKVRKEAREKKRKWQLTLQFKDGIQSLSNALTAGYAIENAFPEAVRDLRFLYDEDADIVKEFHNINQQLKLNRNIEECLMEFGQRAEVEDIISFAEVVTTAKRTGGDLIKIMKITSNNICEKIDVQREITTLVAAKKLEGNIMSLIPFFIIVYLNLCMPDFMTPLYEGIIGKIIMSLALLFYLLAIFLLNKIVTIDA